MFVNRYTINVETIASGTTATTINIPITMEFQMVDQSELIDRVFVDVEVEKSINPIIDYEKVRFLPLDLTGANLHRIIYTLDLSGSTTYGAIGFTDDDIKYSRENFKQSFLNLSFYDTDNPLTQTLITFVTLFPEIRSTDLNPIGSTTGMPGQPKPANQIPLTYILENPMLNQTNSGEGYHLYNYKDELKMGDFKYLYMRGSFKNAKTGRATNLMVQNSALSIDNLVHELYTRFKLFRTTTGFYYEIDDTYHGDSSVGPNNVSYSSNTVTINLYQIKAL